MEVTKRQIQQTIKRLQFDYRVALRTLEAMPEHLALRYADEVYQDMHMAHTTMANLRSEYVEGK